MSILQCSTLSAIQTGQEVTACDHIDNYDNNHDHIDDHASAVGGIWARPVHEAELEDILEAMDLLDMRHMLAQHQFVAANLDILPKYGPEELNLGAVVDKQVKAEATTERLAAILTK